MKKLIFILFSFFLFFPLVAKADGMVIPKPNYYAYESDQRAVILYEDKSQTETMVLSMKFQGNADDFAWIIPVPDNPTVTKGSDEIFTSLAELTQGTYYNYAYLDEVGLGTAGGYKQPVQVIQTQKLDYYDITTLTSEDSSALVKWLNQNGYQYPEGAGYILNSYINNKWYFVAIKIDSSALEYTNVTKKLREGHATPLKMVFKAKNIVYPLKISSVTPDLTNSNLNTNSNYEIMPTNYRPSSVSVELYVLADHKKTLPSFSTSYGNWVKKGAIEKWAVDDQGDPLIKPAGKKYFLTKLTRSMTLSQMTDDLFPRNASDNKKVGTSAVDYNRSLTTILLFLLAISIYSVIVFAIGIFSPFGLAFIIFSFIRHKTKSRVLNIVSFAVQVFCTALYFLAGMFFVILGFSSGNYFYELPASIFSSSYSGSYGHYSSASFLWAFALLVPIFLLLAIMIFIMVWQAKHKKILGENIFRVIEKENFKQ